MCVYFLPVDEFCCSICKYDILRWLLNSYCHIHFLTLRLCWLKSCIYTKQKFWWWQKMSIINIDSSIIILHVGNATIMSRFRNQKHQTAVVSWVMWVPAGMLEWPKDSKEMRERDKGLSRGRISQGCCAVSLGHHICYICEAESQELDFLQHI